MCGCFFCCLIRIAHRIGIFEVFQHRNIVAAVTNGHHLIFINSHYFTVTADRLGLVGASGSDLDVGHHIQSHDIGIKESFLDFTQEFILYFFFHKQNLDLGDAADRDLLKRFVKIHLFFLIDPGKDILWISSEASLKDGISPLIEAFLIPAGIGPLLSMKFDGRIVFVTKLLCQTYLVSA